MPKLGVNMTKATISQWLVKEGDQISEGQHLFDAETDKAIQEIPATLSGVLTKILVQPGDTIACQAPVAVFDDGALPAASRQSESRTGGESEAPMLRPSPPSRVRISPLAKRLAKELNLDPAQIEPAKPGARIVKADVLAYAERQEQPAVTASPALAHKAPETPSEPQESIPVTGIRATIAERMAQSVHTTARAVLSLRADAQALIDWRARLKADGRTVSYNDLLTTLTARALRAFPIMNARWAQDRIDCLKQINIGIAVDTENGLLVPVIRDADQKGVLAIHTEFQAKLERARAGRSTPEDLADGTFTITNLGMFEIEQFIPIIKPPECAILGVGAIVREPVVAEDGETVAARPRLSLTLAFDHRIVDGAPAARFLQRIKHLAEWPLGLAC